MEETSVRYHLIKLSTPGWVKTYDTKEEAANVLRNHICQMCIVEEGITIKSSVAELLSTACGIEYDLDIEP